MVPDVSLNVPKFVLWNHVVIHWLTHWLYGIVLIDFFAEIYAVVAFFFVFYRYLCSAMVVLIDLLKFVL
jgi:hypothetical protein